MKLNKMQQLIAGLALVVIAGFLTHFIFLKEKRANITNLISKNEKLEQDIRVAKAIQQTVADLREEMEHLRAQLDRLKEILPTEVNKPKFMADVKRIANENGVEILQLSLNKSKRDDVIEEHPFTYIARGRYHDFGNFFAQLSDYRRIVNVKGLNLSKSQDSAYTVNGAFLVSVFTYREPTDEELRAQLEAKKKEKAGKGTKGKKKRR